MFDSNKKENSFKKNDFEKLINFVDDFKTTFAKSNILKNADQSQDANLEGKIGSVLESYKLLMGEPKVG